MRVFIIDTTHMSPELQGGLIGIVGSAQPSAEEKQQCVDTVSHYATDGWAIAADPHTPIGRLAAITAETARVPFVGLNRTLHAARHTGVVPVQQPPRPQRPAQMS